MAFAPGAGGWALDQIERLSDAGVSERTAARLAHLVVARSEVVEGVGGAAVYFPAEEMGDGGGDVAFGGGDGFGEGESLPRPAAMAAE